MNNCLPLVRSTDAGLATPVPPQPDRTTAQRAVAITLDRAPRRLIAETLASGDHGSGGNAPRQVSASAARAAAWASVCESGQPDARPKSTPATNVSPAP